MEKKDMPASDYNLYLMESNNMVDDEAHSPISNLFTLPHISPVRNFTP